MLRKLKKLQIIDINRNSLNRMGDDHSLHTKFVKLHNEYESKFVEQD